MATEYEGGCLCGAVRYKAGDVKVGAFCHCRMCQKAAGAPVVSWVIAPLAGFAWTKGKARPYRSSTGANRLFCGDCGSALAFQGDEGDWIALTTATFDHPEGLQPRHHIFTESQMPWLPIADELPRYQGDSPR
jgi:hypothetical protein